MKKIFLFAFIAFALNVKAQFTLEHTYDSAATWNYCTGNASQLMIVKFEVSGERYVKINRCGPGSISIYDMNHAFIKKISLAALPHSAGQVDVIIYLSEHLFDADPGIEFMYVSDSTVFSTTKIYNEDGSLLFTSNGIPNIIMNVHLQQYPIYNTSVGTKMILSYENGQAKVFSLSGTLTSAIQAANENILSQQSLVSNPYPNPSTQSATIDYQLPDHINRGEIVFYNLQGKEVKRFTVDNTFDSLHISATDISAGTYYYLLVTESGSSTGKKMVVIK
ncbi:MAG: T9SS type A sorting domain-containing protein [Bacteroidia bacterium]|nr:T9SS type A sorting domain-containing protein [Bacteroidia bacterium]